MSGILSIKEVAEKYKLLSIGTCNCGGYPTEKYSDGVYTLFWRKTKYTFMLKKRNEIIKQPTPVKYLQDFMAEHFKTKKDA